jgi:hypothetical protein
MSVAGVVAFVRDLVKSWDVRRADCLANLTYALMRAGRLGVAEIGRFVPTPTTDKHHVKAVDRFLGNQAIDLLPLWSGLIALACYRTTRLFVLIDWTDLGNGFEVLKATVSYGGRSQPVAWVTTRKGYYGRSRNLFESNFCRLLKTLLPPGVELVIVADRGFARVTLFRALKKAGIWFIIRVRRDVHLVHGRGRGRLEDRRMELGRTRDLEDALYTDRSPIRVRCVITWGIGKNGKIPKSPWYLVTNLRSEHLAADDIVDGYKKRMRIEQAFRDEKSLRFGFQLRSVRLSTIERYDRLFAIAALAMLLLVMLGAHVERHDQHKQFKANTSRERTHSLFRLGLHFLLRLRLRRPPTRLMFQAFAGAFDAST